jgi:hypothetical protein
MRAGFRIAALAVAGLASAAWGEAHDNWDLETRGCNDDSILGACNQLLHGVEQRHDMEAVSPARDLDYYVVETKARRSYEVRVFGANNYFQIGSTSGAGPRINRVNGGGTILTPPVAPDGSIRYGDAAANLAVRWIGGAVDQRSFIQFEGREFDNPGANDQYSIVFWDTTYFVPRFNNSGSQTTVFLIQNASQAAVTGSIFFYSATGTLLHTEPLSVPLSGLQVVQTASITQLAGQSGHATIAHTGGWGALAAKAVALEPSTGFTFDTVVSPLPR